MPGKSTDPKHIDISLSRGMKISWMDGHESQYSLEHLRENCPCATCREAEEAPAATAASNPFQMYKQPKNKLKSAEGVGRYAVRFVWADGHDTGIYSFDLLRDFCPCPQCREAHEDAIKEYEAGHSLKQSGEDTRK